MRAMPPFVEPEEPTAREAIAAIGEELATFEDDEMERLRFVMDLGRRLPPFPAEWQDDAHRVPGCLSKVWLESERQSGRIYLAGASDAPLVHGLVSLVLRVYSGRPCAEAADIGPEFLKDLGLVASLTPNRGNGVVVMATRIQALARTWSAGQT